MFFRMNFKRFSKKTYLFLIFLLFAMERLGVYGIFYDPSLLEEETICCLRYFLLDEPSADLIASSRGLSFKQLRKKVLSENCVKNHFLGVNFLQSTTKELIMRSDFSRVVRGSKNAHKYIVVKSIGGLGNQLFYYAAAYALSKKMNGRIVLITEEGEGKNITFKSSRRPEVLDLFPIQYTARIDPFFQKNTWFRRVRRMLGTDPVPIEFNRYFVVSDNNFHQITGNEADVYLVGMGGGFYEDFSFFKKNINELRDMIVPLPAYEDRTKEIKSKIKSFKNSIAVHIRWGDFYAKGNEFRVMPFTYYTMAMRQMAHKYPDAHFFVFTDSPEKVKPLLMNLQNCEIVSDGTLNHIDELFLMTECAHLVIANSTFSSWAGFLKRHGDVVAPFPKKIQEQLSPAIYPDSWLTIDPFHLGNAGVSH